MAVKTLLLDTNVLVRLLTGDLLAQRLAAVKLIEAERDACLLYPATLSEVVYVVRGSAYRWGPSEIVEGLRALLLPPVTIIDRAVVVRAVDLFERHHRDWDDCLLAAYALDVSDGRIASFDRGLDRIPGVQRLTPA